MDGRQKKISPLSLCPSGQDVCDILWLAMHLASMADHNDAVTHRHYNTQLQAKL